jgi:cellulose synthase/poly-beta-1,6-N-acetylglucosamine synthase-like glycosyltransferase
MDGFKSQQHRWTKGSIQVCKKALPDVWRSAQPMRIKLESTAHLAANFAYLLMFGVLVLMYPASFMFQNSWQKFFLLDLPIFFFASVSVIIFYITAQGAQRPLGWLKAIPLLPLLMALGVGMSINNGLAVLEALFNRQSDFVRTPKAGDAAPARRRRYKVSRSLTFWVELGLALYFTWLVWLAIVHRNWGSLPFLAMFQFGFIYVVAGSLKRWFQLSDWNQPSAPDTTDAIAA